LIRDNPNIEGVATMRKAKRLVHYEKIRNDLNNIFHMHEKECGDEYEKHSSARRNRVTRELAEIAANPMPGLEVAKSISSDRYVYFLLKGIDQTPFRGGIYCGVVCLSPNYPFQPPKSFVMLSPSGSYFLREGIQWNTFPSTTDKKWNPLTSSLRDYFAKVVSMWVDGKFDWNFDESKVEVLAKSSLESCVELCPDFDNLFPAYSSAKHSDIQDGDDNTISENVSNEWEIVDFPEENRQQSRLPIRKPKKE